MHFWALVFLLVELCVVCDEAEADRRWKPLAAVCHPAAEPIVISWYAFIPYLVGTRTSYKVQDLRVHLLAWLVSLDESAR